YTPALAMMVLIQAGLYKHFGSGPLWLSSDQISDNSCSEYWWSTLLYVENYVNPNNLVIIAITLINHLHKCYLLLMLLM
ncbi:hypothetical protein L9F63_015466, partial [Diploptera punctata]